jgi:hypothetical protein
MIDDISHMRQKDLFALNQWSIINDVNDLEITLRKFARTSVEIGKLPPFSTKSTRYHAIKGAEVRQIVSELDDPIGFNTSLPPSRPCESSDTVSDHPRSSEAADSVSRASVCSNADHSPRGDPDDKPPRALPPKARSELFVLALLSEGLNYRGVSRFLTKIGIRHPYERQFYYLQNSLSKWIYQEAQESANSALRRIHDGDVISFDRAWNHCRNGTKLFGTLCNSNQKHIIGFAIVEQKSKLFTNFEGSSNAMEATMCRELLTFLDFPAVTRLVIDGDVILSKIIRNSGRQIKHLLDINHAVKSFIRKFNGLNAKGKKILEPLAQSIVRHFQWLVKQRIPATEKKLSWRNVVSHFQGNHSQCTHPPSRHPLSLTPDMTEAISSLSKFVQFTEYYFDILDPDAQTQMNESVNTLRGRIASKSYAWRSSFVFRMCFAVLHTNNPYRYFLTLADHRDLELPDRDHLESVFDKEAQLRTRKKGARKNGLAVQQRGSSILRPHLGPPVIGEVTGDHDDFSQMGEPGGVE